MSRACRDPAEFYGRCAWPPGAGASQGLHDEVGNQCFCAQLIEIDGQRVNRRHTDRRRIDGDMSSGWRVAPIWAELPGLCVASVHLTKSTPIVTAAGAPPARNVYGILRPPATSPSFLPSPCAGRMARMPGAPETKTRCACVDAQRRWAGPTVFVPFVAPQLAIGIEDGADYSRKARNFKAVVCRSLAETGGFEPPIRL